MRRDTAILGYNANSNRLEDFKLINMSLQLIQALICKKYTDLCDLDETVARLKEINNR